MIDHMPWLLGSIGTMVFDITIFVQFLTYGTQGMVTAIRVTLAPTPQF
jgi:hypothetical protein